MAGVPVRRTGEVAKRAPPRRAGCARGCGCGPSFRSTDTESASESAVPTVLVYESPPVSVRAAPTVSVSWLSTKRCSVPICSLAALASWAFPSRMNATAALPRPSRWLTWPGSDR